MADDLLVLHASELLSLRGPERARTRVEMSDLSMIRDGAVVVSDGIVTDVGKSECALDPEAILAEIEERRRKAEYQRLEFACVGICECGGNQNCPRCNP